MKAIAIALSLVALLAACQGRINAPELTHTQKLTPTATPTQAPVIPIEIIDGEIWVAIPIEGMEECND